MQNLNIVEFIEVLQKINRIHRRGEIVASIRDVAKKADVSATTVSRVLNDKGYVSEDTRKKVLKAMKDLNYTPNELARNLFHKKAGIVAVLVPDISHPFFSEFVKYVEMELYEAGFKTMICNTIKEQNYELEYLDMLNRHIVDGIITGVHSLEIEEYLKINKPIVALDRYLGENIPVVGANHKRGGEMAAKKLIESGCKCVVQFQGSLAVETPSHDRHISFKRVMEDEHIHVYSYELEWNRFDESYFEKVVHQMFEKHPEIDGVFGTDLLAISYLKEAIKKGKRIPEDVKIVAYDGTYVTEIVTPTVTSIVQPIDQLARECVHLVSDLINGKVYKKKRVVLDVELREGETT